MALTFKTTTLLGVIDAIVQERIDAEAQYRADCAQARADFQREWEETNMERVRELRDYLTRRLKTGAPPRTSEARRIMGQVDGYRSSGVVFFDGGGDGGVHKPGTAFYREDELEGLAALLRAHQGETVTAHQLKELGTHPRDLEKLFRAAVQAGAKVE